MILVSLPSTAQAHFLPYDSVDNDEIRYNDHTQWDDSRTNAIAAWNALASVDMKADTASTAADLNIEDYNRVDDQCGYYTNTAGADEVYLNNRYYPGYNTTQRRACTAHEFGHAYGFNHSYTSQVMDPCPPCYNNYVFWVPQGHDNIDYDTSWG